ncbi:MAG: hypothetical protein M1490_05735 [Candidatus Bathyarchaeota archaeon]|nr:hypothetical protein [Candidatus Bathyarchaeota archaeon]
MNKKIIAAISIILAVTIGAAGFQATSAGTMFVIVLGSQEISGSGWFAGYVVNGQSGTYTLRISASGSEHSFPITDVKVIVLVSNEAAAGGIQSLTINETSVSGYTKEAPSYYGANGGPFKEPDYYGYNDHYVIPQISYNQGHYPDNAENITINLQFSSLATENSKVMFLCYGTDAKGHALKTAFSNGTLIVVPEYALGGLVAFGACFFAFIVFNKRYSFSVKKRF